MPNARIRFFQRLAVIACTTPGLQQQGWSHGLRHGTSKAFSRRAQPPGWRVSQRTCALALAGMLGIGCLPPVHAGTLYKCIGDDGAAAYVNQRIKGDSCSVVSQYDSNAPHGREGRDLAGDSHANAGAQATSATDATGVGVNQGNVEPSSAPAPDDARAGSPEPMLSGHVEDFGDRNGASVLAKIREPNGGFRYVQIGDSHTAGDYLTDQLRVRLQARLGDGGDGWAMPMRVPGQRLARVSYDFDGWELISSRTSGPTDYPFGGLIAQVARDDAVLTIKSKQGNPLQAITAIIRQGPYDEPLVVSDADAHQQLLGSPVLDGHWHSIGFSARLPVTVIARHSRETAIGGWWLNAPQPGAIVSAVGINGSELSQWSRWRSDWMADLEPGQPDLIALAYGTNEGFGNSLDETFFRNALESAIDQLRQRFPHAAILILGAPESLTAKGGSCGVRGPSLDAVQRIQEQVASNRKTLFWDWQRAMGGACSMKRWIRQGLGRGDGVHFSATGYAQLGDDLYQGLDGLARRRTGNAHESQTRQIQPCRPQGSGPLLPVGCKEN